MDNVVFTLNWPYFACRQIILYGEKLEMLFFFITSDLIKLTRDEFKRLQRRNLWRCRSRII